MKEQTLFVIPPVWSIIGGGETFASARRVHTPAEAGTEKTDRIRRRPRETWSLKLKTKVFHTDRWGFLFCTSQLQISHETNNRQNFLTSVDKKSPASKAVGWIVKRNITAVAGGEKSVSSTGMRQITVELFSTCQTPWKYRLWVETNRFSEKYPTAKSGWYFLTRMRFPCA